MTVAWILVKRLPLEQNLAPLSEFLRARGLEHRIAEEHGEQVVFVRDPEAIAPLDKLIDDYLGGELELPDTLPEPQTAGQLTPWHTPVTLMIIVLSVLGCLIVSFPMGHVLIPWLTFQAIGPQGFLPLSEGIFTGQVWRLITPAFLHFGFFHLLFNSLWLWDLGRRLELGLSRRHYWLFLLVTAAASNIVQYVWGGPALFGGMSGVVYALVGFIWMRQQFNPHPLFAVPKAIIGFMLFWLVLCMTGVVDYFIAGSVANAAHVGGLAAGMLWGVMSARQASRFE